MTVSTTLGKAVIRAQRNLPISFQYDRLPHTSICVFHVLANLFFNLVIESFILFKIFYLVLDSLITFQFNPEFHPTQT
jgi:hypothetical protein